MSHFHCFKGQLELGLPLSSNIGLFEISSLCSWVLDMDKMEVDSFCRKSLKYNNVNMIIPGTAEIKDKR